MSEVSTKSNCEAAVAMLDAVEDGVLEDQNLHGAKFEGEDSPPVDPTPDDLSSEISVADKIDELLDQIGEASNTTHKQHPYGEVWQPFNPDELAELVANIKTRGLDQEILLYQDMVLEGWHRYLACCFAKIEPRFVQFEGTDLAAAERVHASGVRRQSSADQRYAAFVLLGKACPAFQAKIEELKQQGIKQKNAGTALATDNQRVDVVAAKAKAAGVGRSTAVKVEQINKHDPNAVVKIAKGKTTANNEIKKLKDPKPPASAHSKPPSSPPKRKDSGENPNLEPTCQVIVTVTDNWIAQTKDFLKDFGIKSKLRRKDEFSVFQFDGSAIDEDNLLTRIGDLLKANGPVCLQICLGPQ